MSTLTVAADFHRADFRLSVDETLSVGGVTAVYGPSGSGKTSLLRIIAGLERPPGGRVRFDDTIWQDAATWVPPHLRRVGYVFQDARLFSHLDVRANLSFPESLERGDARVGFQDVVDALDLGGLLDQRSDVLSGGERQRVAIGRSLLAAPRLLLMDEPLSSLDLRRKREVIPYIEALPSRFDMPILYVTHDADEVTRLADRMLVLDGGRIMASGDVADVFGRVDFRGLAGHHETGSVLRGRVIDHAKGLTVVAVDGQVLRIPKVERALESTMQLRIRARDVVIANGRPENLSIRNALEARLIGVERLGDIYAELLLDVGTQHLRAHITTHALDELKLVGGQRVYALIKSVALESLI